MATRTTSPDERLEDSERPQKQGSGLDHLQRLPESVDGRRRVVIEGVAPEIDSGRFPIKRVSGQKVVVEADIFADGHDVLTAVILFRQAGETGWSEAPLEPLVNDRWRGHFEVTRVGSAFYTVEAWVDHFKTWRQDTWKKRHAAQDISVELVAGAKLLESAAARADAADAKRLDAWAREVRTGGPGSLVERASLALGGEVASVMARHPDRRLATRHLRELRVVVDPVLARFGAWYEMFPRSCPGKAGAHGTFKDVEAYLPRIAEMGFDVLYLPPIHPIGQAFRKGKNNVPACTPGDPGSPWGIGAEQGGHKAIHPELGTLEDFQRLVTSARERKIEVALDIAFQCSPDHPYVTAHPDWFRRRPDGTIQYAENPPKKYQDIYPLDFECDDWRALWEELKSVIVFWIEAGVRVFRVDNPHTKALPFWEWAIAGVKEEHPATIFLSEAFTRPKLMYRLAKLGFTQSYNYFPWRNTKHELTAYLTELTRPPLKDFFRANLWPNTPDILPQFLQYGGRPAFMARLVLAATLGASYGIYGPAFELGVNQPRENGSEEYMDSEKYEIKEWNTAHPDNLTELISRVNRIRRENPALQSDDRLVFHAVDNEQIIAYSKVTEDRDNVILVAVNLDPRHLQSGWLDLSLGELGLDPENAFQVHDLLTGERYLWRGSKNFVQLDPAFVPAAIFRLRRRIRTERDFDYFL
jgi:starch synthase (maltosyl-transferring)